MAAYAIGNFHEMSVNSKIVLYLKRIDVTLEPFDGQFLVHGTEGEVVEGTFPGQVIVIEFPDLDRARAWYHSEAYQEILPLRTNNAKGSVILVDGVPPSYQASDLLRK